MAGRIGVSKDERDEENIMRAFRVLSLMIRCEKREKRLCISFVAGFLSCILLALCVFAQPLQAAENHVVLYRIGESGDKAWTDLKQYFEGKGYGVTIHRGEMAVEKHAEKASIINRGPGKILIALQVTPGERSRIMVAAPEAKKGEGRFLTIDEVPGEFKQESERLAGAVAEAFNAKVRHLPLFPLLGINMPGIMINMEIKETEIQDAAGKLYGGVEKYFRERKKK